MKPLDPRLLRHARAARGYLALTASLGIVTAGLVIAQAVLLAACCNGLAIFFFPLAVAQTLALGTVETFAADQVLVFAALLGAITWMLVAWIFRMPVSATHALIGALLGAAVARGGSEALIASGVIKLLAFVLLTPLFGFLLGALIMIVIAWLYVHALPRRVDKAFRRMQLLSAGLYNLGHGANNAQKCMGMLWMLLLAAGALQPEQELPTWVVAGSYATVALGTLFGGWRVVKMMGKKVAQLRPVDGFSAEAGAALTLILATNLGVAVSPRQALTGAVVGVNSPHRMSTVRWKVVGSMVKGWVVTIPAAAFAGAIAWWLGHAMLVTPLL